jgi:hypothetical protein
MIARVTGVRLHDYGCSLKAYRRELLDDLNLYGELHRFLPALAAIEGARITEVEVHHEPRRYGQSKYGIDRTFRVLMDLLTVWFMKRFLTLPMHGFGFWGLAAITTGVLINLWLLGVKVFSHVAIGTRPLLMVGVLAILSGIQFLCFGLLAGNFGAMAMEPMGHIAGTASSAQGFISTIVGSLVGFLIGQQFDGSVVPMAMGMVICGVVALGFVLLAEKGRLFVARNAPPVPAL